MTRHTGGLVRLVITAVLAGVAAACTDQSGPSGSQHAGPGPADPAAAADSGIHIAFSRASDTVAVGDTQTVQAVMVDRNGQILAGEPLTWTISDSTVASIDSYAHLRGRAPGAAVLSASGRHHRADASVIVVPVPVTRIVLPVSSYDASEGSPLALAPAPALIDRNGAAVSGRTLTFTSSDPSVLAPMPAGGVLAVRPGRAVLTIRCDSATAQIPVTVHAAPIAAVEVHPSAAFLTPGRDWHITSQLRRADIGGALVRHAEYASQDPSVASVDTGGVITGITPGTTTVVARAGGQASSVAVSVAAPGPGAFHVDLRFLNGTPSAVRSAARAAAARWERAIVGALTPYRVQLAPRQCGSDAPALDEVVPNVIVFVGTAAIDGPGGTLGSSRPCVVRDGSPGLPAVGTITIDTADVASSDESGILGDLLAHELGHVLGIGTLWWNGTPPLAVGRGTPSPVFTGARARGIYAAVGFDFDSAAGVPIESGGLYGTRDMHWSGTHLGHELMTGTLHVNGNVLSAITIAALGDLGYVVVPEAGDEFSTLNFMNPFGLSLDRGVPRAARAIPVVEVVAPPRFEVSRTGGVRVLPEGH